MPISPRHDLPYRAEPASDLPALLGESPLWHPLRRRLFYVDIPGKTLHALAADGEPARRWALNDEPGCIAACADGSLLIAQRNGLWRLDPDTGVYLPLAPPPYDPTRQRFNDGKPDVAGRLWVGTIDDARAPEAALYRHGDEGFVRMADGITSSNGIGWSPDGRQMYWSDTKAHAIYRLPFDGASGTLGEREVFARFPLRDPAAPLEAYGGRPDGAAVDRDGNYWVAMFEGQRLLQLSPQGQVLREVRLPVRCPTMPCFGGEDLLTLYVTTARQGRPADELAAQPWAGQVLRLRVEVPGLPAHLARLPD